MIVQVGVVAEEEGTPSNVYTVYAVTLTETLVVCILDQFYLH